MKTLIHSVQNLPRSLANPLDLAMLPMFFVLVFLPSILHLAAFNVAVTNPLAVSGPVAAGFWLAASFREIRVSFALLGPLLAIVLWSVNWLMLAGHTCCGTID